MASKRHQPTPDAEDFRDPKRAKFCLYEDKHHDPDEDNSVLLHRVILDGCPLAGIVAALIVEYVDISAQSVLILVSCLTAMRRPIIQEELCYRPTRQAFIMLNVHGKVRSCGKNPRRWYCGGVEYGHLGHINLQRVIPWEKPEPIPALTHEKVRALCILDEEIFGPSIGGIFAITAQKIYAWGSGQNGSLGLGKESEVSLEPRVAYELPVEEGEWVQIVAGDRMGAALTSQ